MQYISPIEFIKAPRQVRDNYMEMAVELLILRKNKTNQKGVSMNELKELVLEELIKAIGKEEKDIQLISVLNVVLSTVAQHS